MKRSEICIAILAILVILLIGMPNQNSNLQAPNTPHNVINLGAQGSKQSGTLLASGNYIPEKIDANVASTKSIIVRPSTNKTLRRALMIKAYKGKNYAMSKALFKKALARSLKLRKSKEIRSNLYVVSGANVNTAKIRSTYKDQSYHLIEPNYKVKHQVIPINDAGKNELWGLGTPEESYGINAEAAWEYEDQIKKEVIVAVIDSGVNCKHVDLEDVCWKNPKEKAGDSKDNDGNGYVDDKNGYDFINHDNDPSDDNGHGTHVAGTIAAIRDNNYGIAGVTSKAKILPLKFLDKNGYGYISDAISAIDYVIKLKKKGHNIRVINMSYGSTYGSTEEFNVIKEAGEVGITVVAAAGNDYGDYDNYPAAHNLDNIISVAAHQKDYDKGRGTNLAKFSNYGPTVHVSAPGDNILSLKYNNNSGMISYSGTSMATPHVSGVVAILAGLFPDAKPSDYRNWIVFGGHQLIGDLTDKVVNATILDAKGAIEEGYKMSKGVGTELIGYVLEQGVLKLLGKPDILVELKIDGKTFGTTRTSSHGYYSFFITKKISGKNYELVAYENEAKIGSQSGTIGGNSAMLAPYILYPTKEVMALMHVLDKDLKVVTDRSFNKWMICRDGTEAFYFGYLLESITDRFLFPTYSNFSCVFGVFFEQQIGWLDYAVPIHNYDLTSLSPFDEDREVVILPKGVENASQATKLPAPFIANIGSNSVEVNMKPFNGVDYNNKKGLVPYYYVSIKNEVTEENFSRGSYSPKLVLDNLEKGRYGFKYAVYFHNSKGQRVSGVRITSPTTTGYVGYPFGTIFPKTHLYRPQVIYNNGYVSVEVPINDVVYNEREDIYPMIEIKLKNLENDEEKSENIIITDTNGLERTYTTTFHISPGPYEVHYRVHFVDGRGERIKAGGKYISTDYSDASYIVFGYKSDIVHPKMKLQFGFSGLNDFSEGVYNGVDGYTILPRYKIKNLTTDITSFEYGTDINWNRNRNLYTRLMNNYPKGLYEIQMQFEIRDNNKVLATTEWSNYMDFIVEDEEKLLEMSLF